MSEIKINKMHLQKMKNAGMNWVRLDVKKPICNCVNIFKEAHKLGLKVIAVVTSKRLLRGLGFGTENYLPGSNWENKWKKLVEEATSVIGPYVEIWQIDNELNHPWHNPIPSTNTQLAVDIVEAGVDAVKNTYSAAKIAVNVFYKGKGPLQIPGIHIIRDKTFILKYKEQLKNKIDILGMDIYRGTWHGGTPANYPNDLELYHDLWEGDVMIMETGFCTGIFGRSEADQANYVKQVFKYLKNHLKNTPWFRGIVWYEYNSRYSGLPCEKFFGLHKYDGLEEMPAWRELVEKVKKFKRYDKILGITYHY